MLVHMAVMFPPVVDPYARLMRLHQPVGIWLLFWPCAWSVALCGGTWVQMAAFFIGAVAMRAAGCIINDVWDQRIDRAVARTRTRPLASGELSLRAALWLLAALLLISLGVAWVLGARVVAWAAAALPLVALYPAMKRITWWPQLVLGLTFNWGALLGSVAATGAVQPGAWWLYAGGVCWTLGYDTLYAFQDLEDDARLGVKSSARRVGLRFGKPFVAVCYALALLAWLNAGMAAPEWLLAMAAQLFWQVWVVRLNTPASCGRMFKSNAWAGALVWLGA